MYVRARVLNAVRDLFRRSAYRFLTRVTDPLSQRERIYRPVSYIPRPLTSPSSHSRRQATPTDERCVSAITDSSTVKNNRVGARLFMRLAR